MTLLRSLEMGVYNIDNTPLVNIYKVLIRLFNTPYINIVWAIKNGLEYLKDLNIAETF